MNVTHRRRLSDQAQLLGRDAGCSTNYLATLQPSLIRNSKQSSPRCDKIPFGRICWPRMQIRGNEETESHFRLSQCVASGSRCEETKRKVCQRVQRRLAILDRIGRRTAMERDAIKRHRGAYRTSRLQGRDNRNYRHERREGKRTRRALKRIDARSFFRMRNLLIAAPSISDRPDRAYNRARARIRGEF